MAGVFAGKSIPIHCTVCSVEIDSNGNRVEDRGLSDAYAIVPVETPFVDLVPTALAKLGFSGAECVYATGALVIKNWKPLALQEVCISQSATVGEMLAELTTMITLSIRVYRRSSACWIESIREKLASFALGLVWSQGDGAAGGCPVDQQQPSGQPSGATFRVGPGR
ncbi:unnamed protein product [Notodromas monacha]|uniref:CMP domain-containing protein n=1 Tax=Notodromas monacha TaxID=399045 RepID=A0A7R9BZU6_9CRUS|nr:unnamed protein product [Notodromas monacha]CAG0923864.1 unnamed protein product [Notodromas monacha]